MDMDMSTAPAWLTAISLIFLGLGFLCSGVILYDVYGRGYRQRIGAMEAVWPITAIYFGPLALLAYYRWGRPQSKGWEERHGETSRESLPVAAVVATIPGAVASFLGHLVAVPVVGLLGLTIAGASIWPMIILIALFALPLLFAFEYVSVGKGIGIAFLIATVAILAFDVGMAAAMIFVHFVLMFPPTEIAFWFVMQFGLILGSATAYPMVLQILRRDAKEVA